MCWSAYVCECVYVFAFQNWHSSKEPTADVGDVLLWFDASEWFSSAIAYWSDPVFC